jgi:hypothetical protein
MTLRERCVHDGARDLRESRCAEAAARTAHAIFGNDGALAPESLRTVMERL